MNLVILTFLITVMNSYLVEMETYPSKKTCISELFKGGEPISLNVTVSQVLQNRYSIYLTIETSTRVLLAHKKHDNELNVTNLTFNNEEDQDLYICIDNFESYEILVAIQIKVHHDLGLTDSIPNVFDYNQLNLKLDEVKEKIDSGYSYFVQNEAFTTKLVEAGASFEIFMVLVTFITIGSFIAIGFLQVFFIRKDIVSKKTW